ncbi:protoporphyrinogen oxidase [Streptomyces sp. F63]|uniref:protoporphyrinogen oxidase n=1 Tax=Streptomyces sp. F63 TaxID=2824887 RepID=UPI001B3855CE|nr:protoporphyrinogen oxidase [Streptomyces sp. F63]MBQ0986771.1 protoporphyrinogen oxidase [Streptomyces sp. F63]
MSETRASAGHVVVVGGGVSGLAAAHRLLAGGARVTVLEASPRIGGKLLAGELAGVPVDFGAESMLARRPEAVDLARSVGLSGRLQPPATASATLWTRGALRPMPKGHVMGVPGDVEALAASGVVSEEGLARIGREPLLPPAVLGEDEDVAVGEYLADRLGREVVDRLVEPLLGGVYAGDSYRISLRAAVPQLYRLAREGRSLTEGVRELQRRAAGQPDPGPVFMGLDGGVGTLPPAVAAACRAAGAEVATGVSATELRRTGEGWRLAVEGPGAERAAATASGTGRRVIEADAVVLAVPAPVAARLLAAEAPAAAAELAAVEYASMALVSMVFRRAELTPVPEGSGFLVPPVDGHTIKAATFASRKWGWIDAAAPDLFVIRTSVGRFGEEAELKRDDAGLVDVSLRDLGEAAGLRARPVATRVTRWTDGLPQYPVGHPDRVARVRERLAGLPSLRLCGAAYDGVGIPACIASAAGAAGAVLDTLTRRAADGGGE